MRFLQGMQVLCTRLYSLFKSADEVVYCDRATRYCLFLAFWLQNRYSNPAMSLFNREYNRQCYKKSFVHQTLRHWMVYENADVIGWKRDRDINKHEFDRCDWSELFWNVTLSKRSCWRRYLRSALRDVLMMSTCWRFSRSKRAQTPQHQFWRWRWIVSIFKTTFLQFHSAQCLRLAICELRSCEVTRGNRCSDVSLKIYR